LRAKLALFLAAAVVFAPGWGASDPAIRSMSGGEALTARILAPTVDGTRIGAKAESSSYEVLDLAKHRPGSNKLVGLVLPPVPVPTPNQLCFAGLVSLVLIVVQRPARFQSPRSPPHLLTV
jgi:hypothetical protein